MIEHYKRTYWEERSVTKELASSTLVRGESISQWLAHYIDRASAVLEVGCGPGHNLIPIRAQFGCKVAGIDPSPFAVEKARLEGLDVSVGDLESTSVTRMADALILCHVLEHLVDPIAQLRRCHSFLNTSGILLVEVPNIFGSSSAKNPKTWFSREHLWYFSPLHLRRTLALAGFRSIRCEVVGGPVRILARPGNAVEPTRNEYWAVRRSLAAYKAKYVLHQSTKKIRRLFSSPAI